MGKDSFTRNVDDCDSVNLDTVYTNVTITLRFVHIGAKTKRKTKATSLPDGLIENPI